MVLRLWRFQITLITNTPRAPVAPSEMYHAPLHDVIDSHLHGYARKPDGHQSIPNTQSRLRAVEAQRAPSFIGRVEVQAI